LVRRSLPGPLSKNLYYFAMFSNFLEREVGKLGGMIEFLEGGSGVPRDAGFAKKFPPDLTCLNAHWYHTPLSLWERVGVRVEKNRLCPDRATIWAWSRFLRQFLLAGLFWAGEAPAPPSLVYDSALVKGAMVSGLVWHCFGRHHSPSPLVTERLPLRCPMLTRNQNWCMLRALKQTEKTADSRKETFR
jgi:hypothetical protein